MDKQLSNTERQQLAKLKATRVSHLGVDRLLDKLAEMTAELLCVPTSLINLMGPQGLWIKARHNFGQSKTDQDMVFCQRTYRLKHLMVIEDATLDDEFKNSPYVTSAPYVRFYAGVPIKTVEGHLVGNVCVIDYKPRQLTSRESYLLQSISDIAGGILDTGNNIGFIDPVTLLPNRRKLMCDIEELSNGSSDPQTLILLETTRQEYYDDLARSFGIDAIESLFSKIARLLENSLPAHVKLYSGMKSRFSLLVPCEEKQKIFDILAAFEKRMQKEFHFKLPIRLVFKSGYYDFDPSTIKPETAFRRTFSAFCNALANDTSTSPYRLNYDRAQREKLKLTNDIRIALTSSDQLYLAYQPKICLKNHHIVGFEALLRWKHPRWGGISPADFIPLVSNTTLINPLTLWVIRKAIQAVKQFEALGPPLPVSVNVTTTNLIDDQFSNNILEILREFDIEAGLLEIECLETEELLNNPQVVATLNTLKDQGVRIALDDFGSGYSNLKYLRRIPARVIKLDKSLITNINTDPDRLHIAAHLIQMLQGLGFEVVAEGIEDAAVASKLKELNCNIGQGYFFHRPMPLEDALHLLRTQHDDLP